MDAENKHIEIIHDKKEKPVDPTKMCWTLGTHPTNPNLLGAMDGTLYFKTKTGQLIRMNKKKSELRKDRKQ